MLIRNNRKEPLTEGSNYMYLLLIVIDLVFESNESYFLCTFRKEFR